MTSPTTSRLTHLTFGLSLVGVLLVAASRIVEALATISDTVERERQRREGLARIEDRIAGGIVCVDEYRCR